MKMFLTEREPILLMIPKVPIGERDRAAALQRWKTVAV